MNVKLIFFLIVIAFSVVQSIIKAATEKAEARKKQERVGRPAGNDRVQSEIDSFLQEVTGRQPANRQGNRAAANDDIQAQRDQERADNRREEANVRRRAAQATSQLAAAKQKKKRANAAPQTGQSRSRKPNERRIGSSVSEHVDSYIGKHVDTYLDHDVDEYVENTITKSVQSHLGGAGDASRPSIAARRKTKTATNVAALMKDPQGVRNAILINEILSRPRSTRN